jgi:hypothetical protein
VDSEETVIIEGGPQVGVSGLVKVKMSLGSNERIWSVRGSRSARLKSRSASN